MKYNLNWLIERSWSGNRIKYLYFWSHERNRDGSISSACFSQWWAHSPFENKGIQYATAEHWMMAEKARLFGDDEILQKILVTPSSGEAKQLGRNIKNFDQKIWDLQRMEIVIRGNHLKFTQNPEICEFLLSTGKRIIVEASPVDRIWGIGMDKEHPDAGNPEKWKGLNLLGFALMEVRDMISRQSIIDGP